MEIENTRMLNIYNNSYYEEPKEYFKKCIELLPKFNSLTDIGCANGAFLNYINHNYSNKNLIGIDSNNYNIDRKNYKFINKDFVNDNIVTNKSDVVTCMGVLSGYKNIDIFFYKLLKLLNYNGTIIIFDNVNLINLDFNIKYRNDENINSNFVDKYYSYWYSKKTFEILAEKYDLNVEFIPFEIPFEIPKNEDYGRAYTKNIDNIFKQFVYNDFPINFNFIKYTFKPRPIMFHHFHNDKNDFYAKGSLSEEKFELLIQNIGRKKILDFDVWIEKYNNNTLKNNETCFTFDDGLKCQYDIVLPILKKYNIKACWSIISSTIETGLSPLESLKYIENFYFKDNKNEFFNKFKTFFNKTYDLKIAQNYRSDIEFYSIEEREFRYIRDNLLSLNELNSFIDSQNLNIPRLFINSNEIKELLDSNQIISNHTHNHRTDINKINYNDQLFEYKECNEILSKYIDKIEYATLPCGFNNNDTNKIFKKLNISNILGINNFIKRIDCNLIN